MSDDKNKKGFFSNPVIILAIVHRHIYPLVVLIAGFILLSLTELGASVLGFGAIFYGIYTFIGWRLHFRHIYCSYQMSRRKRMTPDDINLNNCSKLYTYGEPIFFVLVGAVIITAFFIYG